MKRKIFSILFALLLVLSMSLITAVPSMAKGSPGNGNQSLLELETLTVDADGTVAESTTTLVSGLTYRLEVSGTFEAGDTIEADAEYSLTNRIAGDTWTNEVSGYESYGDELLDLKIDGENIDWGAYSDAHVYTLDFVGSGDTIEFQIYDIYYPNNSGSLTVKIFATCTTIQDGVLTDSDGELLVLGYDQFGYNYQAYMFNGRYCDYDRVIGGAYCDVDLVMKWNDAWLSNKDCDGDGKLDRHYGYDSYIGSGAWVTNHQSGSYEVDGKTCKWTYFVKIVAAPDGAYKLGGKWYTADDTEIGLVIWGSFAVIQRVYNDPCDGYHGIEYLSPAGPGFGKW